MFLLSCILVIDVLSSADLSVNKNVNNIE